MYFGSSGWPSREADIVTNTSRVPALRTGGGCMFPCYQVLQIFLLNHVYAASKYQFLANFLLDTRCGDVCTMKVCKNASTLFTLQTLELWALTDIPVFSSSCTSMPLNIKLQRVFAKEPYIRRCLATVSEPHGN